MADFKGRKGGKSLVQNMGIFFGGLGHGPESLCQISAYYKFFPGLHVFCRIPTGLLWSLLNFLKFDASRRIIFYPGYKNQEILRAI